MSLKKWKINRYSIISSEKGPDILKPKRRKSKKNSIIEYNQLTFNFKKCLYMFRY